MAVNTDCFDIINGKVARISRIEADGTPDYANAVGSVVMSCNVSVALDPQIKTGSVKEKTGSCVDKVLNSYTAPSSRTGLKAKVTFGEMSMPILDIIAQAAVSTVGAAFYPSTNCAAVTPQDSILEVWFDLLHCDTALTNEGGDTIYGRLILPWCYGWQPTTGLTVGEEFSVYEYDVTVKPNGNFGVGPGKDFVPTGIAAGWDHFIYFDTTLPTAVDCAYVALPTAPV